MKGPNTLLKRYYDLGLEKPESLKPLVLGRHLLDAGMAPGPRMGEVLKVLYEAQLDGKFDTVENGMEFAKSKMLIEFEGNS